MNATIVATQNDDQAQVPEPIRIIRHPLSVEAIGTHTNHISAVKGVRGICGHIARDGNSYCGNPRCCPWAW